MTTIAWDGHYLVADKQADCVGYKIKVKKIYKINNHLVFASGSFDMINALYAWFENGADPEKYPKFQECEKNVHCLNIITPEKTIMRYESTPYPFIVDEPFFACGSGPTKTYAPKAAEAGCVVIDNSSLYRMDPDVPLIVPEVNPEAAAGYTRHATCHSTCTRPIPKAPTWIPLRKTS
mgnify:CR=1 FL=1